MTANCKIRVTKEFNFEMAHALWNYDGACKTVHGHSYKLFVTVRGIPISDSSNPKIGMVIDFGQLKKLVYDEIVAKFDHALVISKCADFDDLKISNQMFDNLIVVDYQPTCELMVADFANRISGRLSSGLELFSLRLYETATSYTEWYAEDNQ